MQRKKKERNLAFFYIHRVNLSRKEIANTSLSKTESALILGGILGAGSLKVYPPAKNACYSFRHSEKESAYFHAKVQLLRALNSDTAVQRGSWLKKYRYQSRSLVSLNQIQKHTHRGKKILIQRSWLNHLSAHSLAIWWFDQGSIIGGGRQGVFCTDGFSRKECEILARYLLVVWKLHVRLGAVKGTDTARLYLSTGELQRFLHLILPYLPCVEMLYKCFLRYKSVNLQQRWISHVEAHCPPELRDECRVRLSQWMHVRE